MRPRRPAPRTTPPTPRPRRPARRTSRPNTPRATPPKAAAPDLKLVHGDGALGVHGQGFCVLFSYIHGGPVSLRAHGAEWLYRAPRPVFWRAATENDKACGFPVRSAAWLAADSQTPCTGVTVERESPRAVTVACRFEPPAVPGAFAVLRYTVTAGGTLTLTAEYHGAPGLPELPCFGVRLTTPAPLGCVGWTGLSGETYPDRYKGGVFGAHSETPHITPYLVPQDCGCHMNTHAVRLQYRTPRRPEPRGAGADHGRGRRSRFRRCPTRRWSWKPPTTARTCPPRRTPTCACTRPCAAWAASTPGARTSKPPYHVSAEAAHTLTVRLALA